MHADIRKTIYAIIVKDDGCSRISKAYDLVMMCAIAASLAPLMFREQNDIFLWVERITIWLFVLDYALRWCTADYLVKRGWRSFLLYPFRPLALIDLLSILPAWGVLGRGFRAARIVRLLKIVRIFRFVRYSSQIALLITVLRKERTLLLSVLVMAVFYVFTTALIMFNAEPAINPATGTTAFRNFFDALYWSTVTLTTVGYGDICPTTDIGRLISMLSSLLGIAIIALPSGIITAGYINELRKDNDK